MTTAAHTSSGSYDLLILGSGPAGCTAAIYAARAGLNPTLIRGHEPGGQLTITTDVENFPGFQNIQGPELMQQMEKQAEACGCSIIQDHIESVAFQEGSHTLKGHQSSYTAKAIIISTGAAAKWLGLASEKDFRGFGVSACATCDAPFFRNKVVAVVGGGNTAVEEALFLSRHASKVYVIHRRNTLRAEHILQERLKKDPKIEILWNRRVIDVLGDTQPFKAVKAVSLEDTETHTKHTLPLQGLFIAIGHKPNTAFLKGHLAMDEEGYLQCGHADMSTEIPGIFAAGDVRDKIYRQAVTAAGQGCMAALDAARYLESTG